MYDDKDNKSATMNKNNIVLETTTKKNTKKPYIIAAMAGATGIALMIFSLFLVVFLILGLFNLNRNGSNSNSGYVYESECNYEKTMVTVMDGSNTKVLSTVSLEDYIIGVACIEIGACNGASSSIAEHYVKSQYIASKTYVLTRGQYNSNTKSITIKASTRDQQWCDLEKGCIITKESDTIYHNSYPGDYTSNQINGEITASYKFTEEDLTIFHQYYQDTYGELFLPETYQDKITTFDSTASIAYKSSTQLYWKAQAADGHEYEEILKSTATVNVSDSEKYKDKAIYKLGTYCKSSVNSTGNASINYVKWMIDFAADNTHGYNMNNRIMKPDVDCSSFVYYALLNNGYTTNQLGGEPFYTGNMDEILVSIGFEKLPYNVDSLQEGDIVWHPAGFQGHKYGHTEVYVGNGQNVGAHSNYDYTTGDGDGREVSVSNISREYKAIFRKG